MKNEKAIESLKKIRSVLVAEDMVEAVDKGINALEHLIPMKPNWGTDRTWGVKKKQPYCPKCEYYITRFYFIGGGKGDRVSYCETCGQAIDWSEEE